MRDKPGTYGFVMLVDMSGQERPLYIKVQLGAGAIIGRSFHWSKMDVNTRPQRKGDAL